MKQELERGSRLTHTAVSPTNYLNADHSIKSWLLTRDHKRIALLYLISISFFFLLGGVYALSIRLELLTLRGDLFQSSTYNKLFTQHGIIMVFFFLIPSIPATLGNFLLPLMIGAKDLAFPKLNLLSWYVFNAGGALMGYLGGLHFWWPKMFGRMYPEGWGRLAALVIFVGFNLTFFPQFLLGYMGMPRRYHAYPAEPLWQTLNVMSTAGASILGAGLVIPLVYLIWSARYGRRVSSDPWMATGSDLRLGLVEASEGKVGSPVDQLLLYCFHYDPVTGKYGAAVMNVLKLLSVVFLFVVGALFVLLRRRNTRRAATATAAG